MSVTLARKSSSMRLWLMVATIIFLELIGLFTRRVNLIEHALVSKKSLMRLVPVAHERRDLEQLDIGKHVPVLLQHLGVDGPKEVLRNDLLSRLRPDELQVSL